MAVVIRKAFHHSSLNVFITKPWEDKRALKQSEVTSVIDRSIPIVITLSASPAFLFAYDDETGHRYSKHRASGHTRTAREIGHRSHVLSIRMRFRPSYVSPA